MQRRLTSINAWECSRSADQAVARSSACCSRRRRRGLVGSSSSVSSSLLFFVLTRPPLCTRENLCSSSVRQCRSTVTVFLYDVAQLHLLSCVSERIRRAKCHYVDDRVEIYSILDVIHTHAFTVHVYSEEVSFTLKRCQKWALMYIVRYAVYIRVIFNVTPCIAYHFSRCIFYISWTCVCTTVLSLFLIWESHLLPITYTHIFTRITCVCIDMFVQCNVHVY